MNTILTISTILGGGAALWFFCDKAIIIYRGEGTRRDQSEQPSNADRTNPEIQRAVPQPASFTINGMYNRLNFAISDNGNPGHNKINGSHSTQAFDIQVDTPLHIIFHGCYNTVSLPSAFCGPLHIEDNGPYNNVRRQVTPHWLSRLLGA